MRITTSHSSEFRNILSHFNPIEINASLKQNIDVFQKSISKKYPKYELWSINFYCFYVWDTDLRIFLSSKPFKIEKEKEITIRIPLPNSTQVIWGINKINFPKTDRSKLPNKSSLSIPIDFSVHGSMFDYVKFCILKGMELSLEKGFTLLGDKIILNDNDFSVIESDSPSQ